MILTGTTAAMVAATIVCTSSAQLLQKMSAIAIQQQPRNPVSLLHPAFVASVVLLAAGMMCWLIVLSQLDVSVAYPLLSVNFIAVPLLAHWILGEKLPLCRIIGAILIVAGLCFMYSGS